MNSFCNSYEFFNQFFLEFFGGVFENFCGIFFENILGNSFGTNFENFYWNFIDNCFENLSDKYLRRFFVNFFGNSFWIFWTIPLIIHSEMPAIIPLGSRSAILFEISLALSLKNSSEITFKYLQHNLWEILQNFFVNAGGNFYRFFFLQTHWNLFPIFL